MQVWSKVPNGPLMRPVASSPFTWVGPFWGDPPWFSFWLPLSNQPKGGTLKKRHAHMGFWLYKVCVAVLWDPLQVDPQLEIGKTPQWLCSISFVPTTRRRANCMKSAPTPSGYSIFHGSSRQIPQRGWWQNTISRSPPYSPLCQKGPRGVSFGLRSQNGP